MPKFRITRPDGKTFEVTAPDGATREQVLSYAQSQSAAPEAVTPPQGGPGIGERGYVSPYDKFPYANVARPEPTAMQKFRGSSAGGLLHGAAIKPMGTLALLDRVFYGVGREATSLGGMLPNPVSRWMDEGSKSGDKIVNNMLESRERARTAAGHDGTDWWSLGGQAISPENFILPGAVAARNASMARAGVTTTARQATRQGYRDAAATGAVMGGTLPVDTRSGQDPTLQGLVNTGVGMAGGVGGQALANGAGRAVSAIGRRMAGVRPDVAAADYVRRVMGRMTPDELAAQASTKPVTSAEAMGNPGTVALGALGRREGATADALGAFLGDRAEQAPARIMDDFANAAGIDPRAARGEIDAFVASRQEATRPLYQVAYETPTPLTPALKELATRPSIRSAFRRAVQLIRDAGRDPRELGLDLGDGRSVMTGREAPIVQPTTEGWDYVRRAADSRVQALRDPVTGRAKDPAAHNSATALAGDLRRALREANPAYAEATDSAGDYIRIREAFEDGRRYITSHGIDEAQFARRVSDLSEAERHAFAGGVANDLYNKAQSGRLPLNQITSPRVRAKLNMILGEDAAEQFLAGIRQEVNLARTGARMRPGNGSPTAEYGEAMRQQDGATDMQQSMVRAGANILTGGSIPDAVAGIARTGIQNVGDRFVTRGMPGPVRDSAGAMLMMPPQALGNLLREISSRPARQTVQNPRALERAELINDLIRRLGPNLGRAAAPASAPLLSSR